MNFSQYFKERNVKLGLIYFVIPSTVAYIVLYPFFSGFLLYADLQFLIGATIGEIIALRNRTPDQKILTCGILIGFVGGIISALTISLYTTLLHLGNIFQFFFFTIYILLTGVPVGFLVGVLISSLYLYVEMKGEKNEDVKYDDDFYKDLIEDK